MIFEAIPTTPLCRGSPGEAGHVTVRRLARSWQINYISGFWESENQGNLLFFWGSQ